MAHHPPRFDKSHRFPHLLHATPSSVLLNLVSTSFVLKKDVEYKLIVHLRLNVFNDATKLTRTELLLLFLLQGYLAHKKTPPP